VADPEIVKGGALYISPVVIYRKCNNELCAFILKKAAIQKNIESIRGGGRRSTPLILG